MQYRFYYDESEHSRVVNLSTITGETYYDNFIAAIIGWSCREESAIAERYSEFEEKYAFRKKNGELKNDTFKAKQFTYGFASLNKENTAMLDDFFSIFDEDCLIYLFVASKIEFVILQIFREYRNSCLFDMDAVCYSVVKAILTYRPEEVLQNLYTTPSAFVDSLVSFLKDRIERNKSNMALKQRENEAFKDILCILSDVESPRTLNWDYHMSFCGFNSFLKSKGITDYSLLLDKEGKAGVDSKTLSAAKDIGLNNCTEADSKAHFGIRIADMLAGVIGKLMKSLERTLTPDQNDPIATKTLLGERWFKLNEKQLQLYKKLYHLIFEVNNDWFKVYSGNYSDDLISFLGLLEFMNYFDTAQDIEEAFDMQPEYFNSCVCQRLETHFLQMKNKLTVEPVESEKKDFSRNRQGAKVFFDMGRQPTLPLEDGENTWEVLSVGFFRDGTPLLTVKSSPENLCYRLPVQLQEWVQTLVGMANLGLNMFPAEVLITKENDQYYVDIL